MLIEREDASLLTLQQDRYYMEDRLYTGVAYFLESNSEYNGSYYINNGKLEELYSEPALVNTDKLKWLNIKHLMPFNHEDFVGDNKYNNIEYIEPFLYENKTYSGVAVEFSTYERGAFSIRLINIRVLINGYIRTEIAYTTSGILQSFSHFNELLNNNEWFFSESFEGKLKIISYANKGFNQNSIKFKFNEEDDIKSIIIIGDITSQEMKMLIDEGVIAQYLFTINTANLTFSSTVRLSGKQLSTDVFTLLFSHSKQKPETIQLATSRSSITDEALAYCRDTLQVLIKEA